MQLSAPITIQFRGHDAQLRVVRNEAFCWGRITARGEQLFDVNPPRDLYDQPDDKALAALAGYAHDESCVEPSLAVSE